MNRIKSGSKKMKGKNKQKRRTRLNNMVAIAKCMNPSCGWEARIEDNTTLDDVSNFYCPLCGVLMQGEIN